jgi:HAD superfamily hydrolase (TIGR01484 family)
MDGTLLNEQQKISPENAKWIHAANAAGITVILSTGRGIQNVVSYAKELGLQTPIVAANGSEVWKSPDELYRRVLLDHELVIKLRNVALHYDTWYWAYGVEELFNKDKWCGNENLQQWLKFGYYYENAAVLEIINKELESWGSLEITNSHPYNIEINPKGVNKAYGVQAVCELMGIQMSEVVAMGDSLNDISMIAAAGLGVAMGNAQESVKAAADIITKSNNDDGVAFIIQTEVLGGSMY